ncbi:helix-turn-helix domain-containing protein [Paenibacillus phytohabitans]|uniref:helix-turn-helix domain-containing protein n=1 Tax=Paenibacillus phytohabitans TaxID=2654978 RepID=UPI003009B91A
MPSINELLASIRKERKLSLRAAAEKSGLSHSYIDSLEKGIHPKTKAPIKPSPDSLRLLASAYDYSYKELMDVVGYLDEESNANSKEHSDELTGEELSRERTEYVLRELVKKYNLDLTNPQDAETLEDMIKIVHRNSQK